MDAQNLTERSDIDGKRLRDSPFGTLSRRPASFGERLRVGHTYTYAAGMFRDATNFFLDPPRALHGVFARWTAGSLMVEAGVRNVTDRRTAWVDRNPLSLRDDVEVPQPVTDYMGYPLRSGVARGRSLARASEALMRCSSLHVAGALLAVACAPSSPPVSSDTGPGGASMWMPGDPQSKAVVTTFPATTRREARTVSLDDWEVADTRFVTSGDPVVVVQPSGVYQINRYTVDTLRRYRPGGWLAPLWETHLGDRSNPHDVAECGDTLFVSLYGEDRLTVYAIDEGIRLGQVALDAFADGDGQSPEASSMRVVDGRLYVGLQRLNREDGWRSEGGVVVEVDCAQRIVQRHWPVGGSATLVGTPIDGELLVSHTAHGGTPAGLSRLRLPEGELKLVMETPGEHVTGLATQDDRALAISLAEDGMSYAVSCVDLALGSVTSRESTPRYLTSVAGNDRGEAWVSAGPSWLDPTADSGLFVYDIEDCRLKNDAPIALSLHPFSVGFY